jgi:isohexenylglutaconyl-CoA hydratase
MATAAAAPVTGGVDPIATFNRRFGALIERVDALPCAVVALCEGGVMGGGFGLACVADVVIAVDGARFRLPETSLGISPAQIAPFVVRRVGHSHARRLAVTGETLDSEDALRLQLAHMAAPDPIAAEAVLGRTVQRILRNEPHAVAETKRVVSQPAHMPLGEVLDDAAAGFARLARSERAAQGFQAFVTRTPAPWVLETEGA